MASDGIPPLCVSLLQYSGIPTAQRIYELALGSTRGNDDVLLYAVKTVGRLNTSIRITVSGVLDGNCVCFWDSVLALAKAETATTVHLEQIGKGKVGIPILHREINRERAQSFVLDLTKPNRFSPHHRRNIRTASKNAVRIIQLPVADAIDIHLDLCRQSGERRRNRGEVVRFLAERQKVSRLLTGTPSARIYQAAIGDEVVSSKIVVFLGRYAFFDTAGTSRRGMEVGASHYLMGQVIDELRESKYHAYNLGVGKANRAGLSRFKAGFGANCYEFETVSIDTASFVRNAASKLIHMVFGGTR